MPSAPKPITSPPPTSPDQPYDSDGSGSADTQLTSQHAYDAAGGVAKADPWPKVQQGGAVSDIAKVAVNGKELALGNQDVTKVAVNGKETAVVRANGSELAKGNQDLAK